MDIFVCWIKTVNHPMSSKDQPVNVDYELVGSWLFNTKILLGKGNNVVK